MEPLGPVHIVAIDDDEEDLMLLRLRLQDALGDRLTFTAHTDAEAGLAHVCASRPDLLMLDYRLGPMSGLDALRRLRREGCDGAVLVLTGATRADVAVEMMKAGATDYLSKDQLTDELLLRTVRYCISKVAADHELERSRVALEKTRDDLQAILNHLRLGTALLDLEGRVRFLNDAGERIFEKTRAEVLGCHWTELGHFPRRTRDALRAAMSAPAEMRRKVPMRLAAPNGRRLALEVDVHNDPERPDQRVLFFYDVSDVADLRRQLEDQSSTRELIGHSPQMDQVYQLIHDVAAVDVTVLIEGETGTGKEVVARAIHKSSRRAGKPFVVVNCAGLSDSLLTSQLFGHVRGAFTGAIADHKGVFETAHGGTILLDEIGDVPPRVQTNLLRVLQEREVMRLGESKPRKIDVRVISATHRDLNAEVEAGRFRLDLLYRLRVARVQVPPLRERTSDVPVLARWFLRRVCEETGKQVASIGSDAMRALSQHSWPGNVRELRSAIEFAVVRCKGAVVRCGDLPAEVQATVARGGGRSERDRVMDALERANFNRTAAARMLGISRATLYRRLTELNIDLRGQRSRAQRSAQSSG